MKVLTGILELVRKNDKYRLETLNLQASENKISPDVKEALSSDLASRYSHIMPDGNNSYGGTSIFEEIYETAKTNVQSLYNVRYADIRPIGGHVAVLAAIKSLTKRGDTIYAIGPEGGGYPGYQDEYIPEMLSLRKRNIPYLQEQQEIDYNEFATVARKDKPNLIVLGQSAFVKSYDLSEISEIAAEAGSKILYDGSHVMGLIAGGKFQPDAAKKADILVGSTHKSFFGPQGGLILTNDLDLVPKIEKNLTWMTMDNMHPNRVAALGIAAQEMLKHGKEYAALVEKNSHHLGKALDDLDIPVRFKPWYSKSHQVLLSPSREKDFINFSNKLEKNKIIVDRDGRIGTSEISRMGFSDMERIADLISEALAGHNVLKRVADLVSSLRIEFWR
jgi:glycine hydroxymethyltransferase